ncbi:hypothetical protein Slin15195_G056800 [Septoria linicola]|uniref:DUF7728 domain-containing protein n=1 Tax=Septoria linicola TaxID=215465 RepID=A0A9Q9AXB4_9PEZI|nr:hypothetical protein Slin14017_G072680 [Septoria linicola]USW52361.1 hypothetical protein Slin15195_G056800 [Septoria linicola]
MLGRSVGVAAASALGASAFLIPANIAPFGNDEAASAPAVLNAKQSIVQLPCSECAFTKKQLGKAEDVEDVESVEDEVWAMGSANSIVVNLSVSEDGQKLQVNGETIYPMNFQLESMLAQKIYVNQVASSASVEEIESGKATTVPLEVTGSGVSVHEEEAVTPEGHTIIPIKHSIFELERQPVSLDDVHIKILKTVGGELFIAHVSTEGHHVLPHPSDFFAPPKWAKEMEDEVISILSHPHKGHHGPPHESSSHQECKNLPATLCKLKTMLEDRLMTMRQGHLSKGSFKKGGCHGGKGKGGRPFGGRLPTHIRPHFLRIGQDGDETPRHHGRPHHMRPHGHHDGHHHHKHHFMHSLTHGLLAVLIPTMAGIAVGMVVSLVGLCLGSLISFLWIKLYRGGRRGYESVRLEEEDVVEDADIEKKSFVVLETSEPLPVYEEAPSYEEVQTEQK